MKIRSIDLSLPRISEDRHCFASLSTPLSRDHRPQKALRTFLGNSVDGFDE